MVHDGMTLNFHMRHSHIIVREICYTYATLGTCNELSYLYDNLTIASIRLGQHFFSRHFVSRFFLTIRSVALHIIIVTEFKV